MPFKKPIFLCTIFFISCSTSLRDQIGREAAIASLPVMKPVPAQPLLAQAKVLK
jgi:hypothetical protein